MGGTPCSAARSRRRGQVSEALARGGESRSSAPPTGIRARRIIGPAAAGSPGGSRDRRRRGAPDRDAALAAMATSRPPRRRRARTSCRRSGLQQGPQTGDGRSARQPRRGDVAADAWGAETGLVGAHVLGAAGEVVDHPSAPEPSASRCTSPAPSASPPVAIGPGTAARGRCRRRRGARSPRAEIAARTAAARQTAPSRHGVNWRAFRTWTDFPPGAQVASIPCGAAPGDVGRAIERDALPSGSPSRVSAATSCQ